MLPEPVVSALRYLALSNREKMKYLPIRNPEIRYEPPDEGDDIEGDSEVAFRAALRLLIEAHVDHQQHELHSIRRDLLSVMTLMLMAANHGAADIWWLNKEQYGISSELDDSWLVVQRLALLTLKSAGVEAAPPQLSFEDLIRSAGFRRIRIERHVE
jgi:hypothetical protein